MLFQYHIINMYTKISLLLLNDTNAMIEKLWMLDDELDYQWVKMDDEPQEWYPLHAPISKMLATQMLFFKTKDVYKGWTSIDGWSTMS